MIYSSTPYTENSNQNENLLSIQQQQQNNQQPINAKQFFVENEDNSSENKFILTFLYYRILVPIFIFAFLIFTNVPVSVIPNIKIYMNIFSRAIGIIASLILLIISNNKLEIIKDKSNNKIIIKVVNFLCFPKKIIKIDMENFHFYFKKILDQGSKGGTRELIRFRIINDFKNLVDIDLDESNIKKKPTKFYYTFNNIRNIRNAENQYTSDFNKFLGISSNNYENPLFFNINKYMKSKYYTTHISFFGEILSNYMKFSDHFFTYHFRTPTKCTNLDIIMIAVIIFANVFGIIGIFISIINEDKDMKYFGIYSFVIINVLIFIIYKCLKLCLEKIYRIDCIFSKNFDRIFIGLVKYNETSYVNTFEFQMNNIDRFILERAGTQSYNLKAVFKTGEKQLICNIKRSEKDLEGLAYLLNERLIKNADDINVVTNKEEN